VRDEIIRLEAAKGENFANAREVRNLFERIITNQASRVADLEDVDEEMLSTITIDDLVDEEDPAQVPVIDLEEETKDLVITLDENEEDQEDPSDDEENDPEDTPEAEEQE
jgi:hypothetical protein